MSEPARAPADLLATMREKAELVSAVVSEVGSLDEAFAYASDLCAKKEACQLLVSGCELPVSETAADLCQTKGDKVIAAPGLADPDFARLSAMCRERSITAIKDGMRSRLAGIDIGLTIADYGIAETGTLVIKSSSEELRLATMVCEIHIAILPVSRLKATSFEVESILEEIMRQEAPSYLAFVTGASRTADIERVLALGVHGPLELHILLWMDK